VIGGRYDALSLDQVADQMRLSRERIRQIERSGLYKMGIALTLVELLGHERAQLVLLTLRRRPLPEWRRALIDARSVAMMRDS
jgi:hypothetical protein